MDYSFLKNNKIIPVVVLHDLGETLPKLSALARGGIKVAEITFRTPCAADAISLASKNLKDMLVGAGTVLNAEQCRTAINAGAKFVVSPGFCKEVLDVCNEFGVTYIPGAVTPTEIMTIKNLGLDVIKFFPAGAFGGVKTLKSISAAFPDVRFVPTGGVDGNNLLEFASQKFVAAVGGSWMMKGNEKDIEDASRAAVKALEDMQ